MYLKSPLKHYIAAILLVGVLGSAVPVAALKTDSDDKLVLNVIGTAGTGATYELNPSKFFTSDASFGQDLYENIYNRVKSQGSDIAVNRLLDAKDVSKEQLLLLVPGANIGAFLTQPDPKENLTPEKVETRRMELWRMLAEEKELADLLVNAQMDTEPTEIFANGDESDSGFDLLVDLAIIEQILFGKTETVFGGAGPGAPAGSNVIDVGGAEEKEKEEAAKKEEQKKKEKAKAEAEAGGGAGEASLGPAPGPESSGFEAEVCPVNNSFNAEVEKAIEKEKSEQADLDKLGKGTGKGVSGKGKSGTGGGVFGSGSGEGEGEDGAKIEPEKSANWSKPKLCYGPFCLKIEAKYKKESSYLVNANCIECHFEKINDAFKKTLDHNLIPSKATGNLFELPKCKRSFLNLKWNFIMLPQPILTPPNDDLVVKGDIIKNMIDFYEKYYDNPGRCEKAAGGACKPDKSVKPDPDTEKDVTERKLEQKKSNETPEELFREIRAEVSAKKEKAAKLMEETRSNNDAANQASQFKVLLAEIEMMNEYFDSFKKLYEDLISGANDSPCKVLYAKGTCQQI